MAEWTQARKDAASKAMTARNEARKSASTSKRIRIPLGEKRDLLTVQNPVEGLKYRNVNDVDGRIERFKQAGYEFVEDVQLGSSNVDGNQADSGVVSRDVGKGVTSYVMAIREDWYEEDQAKKQLAVDETESAMRKSVDKNTTTDGTYGECKVG